MHCVGRITLLLGLAPVLAAAAPAVAQDRTGPADVIRVVERVDPATGRSLRMVVEDLSRGEILRLQEELARAGYPAARSGRLDDSTRRGLVQFQTARGLEVCGCVTYETVVALGIAPLVVARIEAPSAAPADAYARTTWTYRETVPVVIYAPGYHSRYRYLGPPVVVGHGPAVVVGHEPAVGAGRYGDRRPPPDPGRDSWRSRFPSRSEPPAVGRRIVPGNRPRR